MSSPAPTATPNLVQPAAPAGGGTTLLRPRRPMGVLAYLGMAGLAGSILVILLADSPTAVGVAVLTAMVLLILSGLPVALSLTLPSILGVLALASPLAAFNVMAAAPAAAVSSWSMSVLPMFIFMGMLLSQSGVATSIYRAADLWFRWLPGGVGIGTTAAGAGLSAVSGSSIGMTYTLGRTGIPEMLRAGYDKRVAVGTVIVAGLPGALIPPSILMLVYAGVASVPVGKQLMAGVVPGVLIAVMFSLVILLVGFLAPRLVGRGADAAAAAPVTWRDRFQALLDAWALPVIMLVLIGGMFSGFFTPTEAGAVAAFVSLLICLWNKRNDHPFAAVGEATRATVAATGAIMFLLIGAEFLTRVLALTGISPLVTKIIVDMQLSPVVFLLALAVLYLFMGMFFDTLSMMFLTVPVLLPTLAQMGIDPIWFGVFIVLMGEVGMITPPVGVIIYVLHGIAQDRRVNLGQTITLRDVITPVLWFTPLVMVFVLLLILVPQIALWLPGLM